VGFLWSGVTQACLKAVGKNNRIIVRRIFNFVVIVSHCSSREIRREGSEVSLKGDLWRSVCCVRRQVEVESEKEVIQRSDQCMVSGAVARVNKVQLVT